MQAAMELLDCDSEEEEFDDLISIIAMRLVRLDRNRVPRYCENVVSRYFDFKFKRLFRLSRSTFDALVGSFRQSPFFPHPMGGRPQISSEKTCLVVLGYLGTQ